MKPSKPQRPQRPRRSLRAAFWVDPKGDLSALPRSLRLAIRKEYFYPSRPTESLYSAPEDDLPQAVDHVMQEFRYGANTDPGFCLNTVDSDFDIDGSDEFSDSREDEELNSLTIVEPGLGNIRRWLRGYDIL